jgi:hypothetical protein
LAGLHALALVAACVNSLPFWIKIPLAASVAIGFRLHFTRNEDGVKSSIERLLWRDRRPPWRLTLPGGKEIETELSGAVTTPWFVSMRWRGGFSLLLCRDSLDANDFRRLRVLLRTRAEACSGDADPGANLP